MVRLGLTNASLGRREDGRLSSQGDSEQSYSHTADEHIRQYPHSHHMHTSNPRSSSLVTEESHTEPSPSASHYSSSHVNEVLQPPRSLLTVFNKNAQISYFPSPGWSQKPGRTHPDVHARGSQKTSSSANSSSSCSSSPDINYTRDIKFCPVCRSSVVAGTAHHCKIIPEPSTIAFPSRATTVNMSQHPPVPRQGPQVLVSSQAAHDSRIHNVPESDDHHIQNRLLPNLLPISQESTCSAEIPPSEMKSGSTEAAISATRPDTMPTPAVTHSMYEMHPSRDQPPLHSVAAEGKPSQGSSSLWSGSERPSFTRSEAWETPTSLISRLTAGLTACSSQSQQQGEKRPSRSNCPSPSISEESDTLSYICLEESTQAEDPFHAAHQELMDEVLKGESQYYSSSSATSSSSGRGSANNRPRKVQKELPGASENRFEKSQKRLGSETVSSELMCVDSNFSKESDTDECSNTSSRYSERSSQPPDIATLLKSIKQPTLIPYVPDKSNIHDFIDPEEIGHINHLIKSLSDSVLTISLPDTLYKNKGFTPLDYMDIHLNAVMRQFFFVFKNEDFLNLLMTDQISLLNGCSLRAVISSGLYLFSKDTGCWYIPGSTNRLNHPVVHISDLLQVYPQHIVSKMYELHSAAAKLDFDWSMGVITNCILMYTPIKKVIQDMEKVDYLRNKYVQLLLKYISWKHGHHNAALIFPELLKILDALLLLVDELSGLTLNLNEEEVIAVGERLSTLTMMQMAPLKSHSNRFKEEISSWSTMKCVNLTEINNRLCMALQLGMVESLRTNTAEYWTASSALCTPNSNHDDNSSITEKKFPQILPVPEKVHKLNSLNYQGKDEGIGERSKISFLCERDLMMLRQFLEDATGRENSPLIENIKEKMDAKQIKLIIKKLCS